MATWTIHIPDWNPSRLNQWDGRHWAVRARAKAGDRNLVGAYAKVYGVPRANGKRRVTLRIVLGPRQRGGDVDCYWKTTLDALKHAGLIVDDGRAWVELMPVEYSRDNGRATWITLEDVDD